MKKSMFFQVLGWQMLLFGIQPWTVSDHSQCATKSTSEGEREGGCEKLYLVKAVREQPHNKESTRFCFLYPVLREEWNDLSLFAESK